MSTGLGLSIFVAVLWGINDSLAHFAERRLGTLLTTALAQISGLLLLAGLGVLIFLGRLPWLPTSLFSLTPSNLVFSVFAGLLLGVVGICAYITLYAGLGAGPLALVSPIVSAHGGITMIFALIIFNERIATSQVFVLLSILCGVFMVSIQVGAMQGVKYLAGGLPAGVVYAIVSAFSFGIFYAGLGAVATQTISWFITLFCARLFSVIFLMLFTQFRQLASAQPDQRIERRGAVWGWYMLMLLLGCCDMGGAVLFSLAAPIAGTGVTAIVGSAYVLLPIAVGMIFLREWISWLQSIGVILIIAGLIGLASLPLAESTLLIGLTCLAVWYLAQAVIARARRKNVEKQGRDKVALTRKLYASHDLLRDSRKLIYPRDAIVLDMNFSMQC